MIWLLSLISIMTANGSITGSDDRHEVIDAPLEVQKLSSSIAALVRKKNLKFLANGQVELSGTNYQKQFGFCQEARFVATQSLIANCSASLIGEDLILTAGHCVERGGKLNLKEFVAVFDYKVKAHEQNRFVVDKSSIYELEAAPVFDFDFPGDNDVAVIKLDRKVKDRTPLKIDYERVTVGEEIFMLGFPFGLPMKYTDNGFVLKETGQFASAVDSFTSDLDSFSVNSGSAVFHKESLKIIGVLVRGTGANYEFDEDRGCSDWGGLVKPQSHYSEINYVDIIKK